ncbi:MAG: alpha-2-macroglobulin family protein [Planctomycetaceae bacterium]
MKAAYYFGAPVTDARVHYKVERTKKDGRWYPEARWDWLYSPGYWWFAPDYTWYPGWNRWGCVAPRPFWIGWNADPPEVVAQGDAQIGEDGRFSFEIDTGTAKEQHHDSDHSYSITAEVVDQSRRTIIGTGQILVAREPYRVFVWTDRGHYRTGDTVTVGVQARTADGQPVKGASGQLMLKAVKEQEGKIVERIVSEQEVTTDEHGQISQKLVVPSSGQYRLSVVLNDSKGHRQEGGYVFFVQGPQEDGRGYRFNDLELITQEKEYQPGDTVKLQINTNQADSTVHLFIRPMQGLCPKPRVIRIPGKSTTFDLEIQPDDQPNIFVEALTISNGRLHSEVKEIVVPPVRKVASVEVISPQDKYRPGQTATVRLKLTEENNRPLVGNTVISVYDASVEYIAANTTPDIRSFFWEVRRHHHVGNQTTLNRQTWPSSNIDMQMLAGPGIHMLGVQHEYFGYARQAGTGIMRGGALRKSSSQFFSEADSLGAVPMAAAAAPEERASMIGGGGAAATVEPTVRSEFADTAFWSGSVTADRNGEVEVSFKVPDNLTTWKIKAWALGDGTRVGSGSSEIISSKDLIIRPQVPRFFTETDQITLSAVVHNYLETAKPTTVILETEGGQLEPLTSVQQTVLIPAGGEQRVDWNVRVTASGTATVRMKALTDEESDAAQQKVPCHVHGILKTESFAGVIRPGQQTAAVVNIQVPTARIEEQSRLEVRFSPTLAGAMIDALPYLLEYPYGCTEQTLNRFLPAVITQATLKRMNVDLAAIREKKTNLNSQQQGAAAERAAQWKRYDRNPVFDEQEMEQIIRTGVGDLTEKQLSDGGWGWFSGYGEHSSAHMTAQIVHGLNIAKKNGVPVLDDVLQRGVQWLQNSQAEALKELKEGDWRREHPKAPHRNQGSRDRAENIDALVAFVLAGQNVNSSEMTDYLYRDRGHLSAYALALTGLVLHQGQDQERSTMVLRNIEQFLQKDGENQTAWLQLPQNQWWYWYGNENEAMARYLQLLIRMRPADETAPQLVKYLLNNRRHGTYWNSTRDTALVVEAFDEYLAATGEDHPSMTVEILVDGRQQKTVAITPENLFTFDNAMVLSGDAVKAGTHRIEIRRTGTGPLYYNAYLTNFTKEESISATGLELKVDRRFYRLERDDRQTGVQGDRGQVVSQQTANYRRIPLENLSSVPGGTLVEVELVVESKNDYEYLLLEDRKPSGFEPDDQRSGYIFEGLRAYRELRDERVSFFLSDLARGRHSVSYRLRAETPSQMVSALPAAIQGMYAPELVGNSNEFKVRVEEKAE